MNQPDKNQNHASISKISKRCRLGQPSKSIREIGLFLPCTRPDSHKIGAPLHPTCLIERNAGGTSLGKASGRRDASYSSLEPPHIWLFSATVEYPNPSPTKVTCRNLKTIHEITSGRAGVPPDRHPGPPTRVRQRRAIGCPGRRHPLLRGQDQRAQTGRRAAAAAAARALEYLNYAPASAAAAEVVVAAE